VLNITGYYLILAFFYFKPTKLKKIELLTLVASFLSVASCSRNMREPADMVNPNIGE
jgi:hypothetical protein